MTARILPILLCLLSQFSFASGKVTISPFPSWLYKTYTDNARKPLERDISNGYYLELRDEQVNIGLQTEYMHFIRNIFNESGVQNASEVSVNFVPDYQDVFFHAINIWRQGKLVSQLDKAQIKIVREESEASSFLYNGLKRAYVVLKDVRKGDRIEVAYSIKGFNPVFAGKYETEIYFGRSTAICNYFRTIIVPKENVYYFKYYNNAPTPVETVRGNERVYHWDNPSLKLWDYESDVPSWYTGTPYIAMSEFSSWKEVADWGLQTFRNYEYSLPVRLKEKIAQWEKEANGDQEDFIEKATQFVQNQVRYLGLEMGENTHKPHSPEEVFKNRFGDCKDKALLLTMILRLNNISAYVALVNTSMRYKLDECLPGATQFNHVIVAIERSNDLFIFIDPTLTHQMGSASTLFVPAYGLGLILRNGAGKLSEITKGGNSSRSVRETILVNAKGMGPSKLMVENDYYGGEADDMRSTLADYSMNDLEESYTKYYAKFYEGIQQQDVFTVTDDSLLNHVQVNKTYTIPEIWKTENGIDKFTTSAILIYNRLPNPDALTKDLPLALSFPLNISYTLSLQMPEDWPMNEEPLQIKTKSYEFSFFPTQKGSNIELAYTFKTLKDHIPSSDLATYKEEYKKMVDLLEFRFTNKNLTGKTTTPAVNILTIFFTLVLVALLFFLFKHLNKKSPDPGTNFATGQSGLKGWLVVLGISLGWQFLYRLVSFFKTNYFSQELWVRVGINGGQALQGIVLLELAITLFSLAALAALLYWFFKKRDIFPRMFIGYVTTMLGAYLLLVIGYSLARYPREYGDLTKGGIEQFIRQGVYAVVWISYTLRSVRVKETFISPYSKTKIMEGNLEHDQGQEEEKEQSVVTF